MLYVSIINIYYICVKVKYNIIFFNYITCDILINPLCIGIYKISPIKSQIWEPETAKKETLERSSLKLCIDSPVKVVIITKTSVGYARPQARDNVRRYFIRNYDG